MALSLLSASSGFAPQAGLAAPQAPAAVQVKMETVADLKKLSEELNPIVGYWNPLGLGDDDHLGLGFAGTLWGKGQEETIGWFRQAEIKHGRVAMFGFVGFCVQSAGIYWPWNIEGGRTFAEVSAAGGPGDQWDAISETGKWQIILFVGLLETISESTYALSLDGEAHYMRGGKPGYFPSLKGVIPHPVPLNFFDPFGLQSKMSPEKKAKGLLAEINNGRLAMIGMLGVLSASKGCIVPGVDALPIAPYAGEYMKPFADFAFLS